MNYNERDNLKECYDNVMFLKDLRSDIPHDFEMSSDLKEADKMLVAEIKYWEDKISKRNL